MVWFEREVPRKYLAGHLAWFFSWVGVTIVALILHPSAQGHGTHQQLGLPPCPSVFFTNRPCPGCGLTTSFSAMAHLQMGRAFEAHLFGPVLYSLYTVSALACLYGYATGKRLDTNSSAFNWAIGALLVAFIAYGALRFATTKATFGFEPLLFHR